MVCVVTCHDGSVRKLSCVDEKNDPFCATKTHMVGRYEASISSSIIFLTLAVQQSVIKPNPTVWRKRRIWTVDHKQVRHRVKGPRLLVGTAKLEQKKSA